VISLGLNNPLCIGFTLVKARIKNAPQNRGTIDVKLLVLDFYSFVATRAPILRFARKGKTPWQTALNCTAVCQQQRIAPWQSALKFRLLTLAIRCTFIFFVAIRGKIIFFVAICGTHLSAVCHNRVKTGTSHFTLASPLFAALIFLMRDFTSVKSIRGGLFMS
jgi:hypothetical protein